MYCTVKTTLSKTKVEVQLSTVYSFPKPCVIQTTQSEMKWGYNVNYFSWQSIFNDATMIYYILDKI